MFVFSSCTKEEIHYHYYNEGEDCEQTTPPQEPQSQSIAWAMSQAEGHYPEEYLISLMILSNDKISSSDLDAQFRLKFTYYAGTFDLYMSDFQVFGKDDYLAQGNYPHIDEYEYVYHTLSTVRFSVNHIPSVRLVYGKAIIYGHQVNFEPYQYPHWGTIYHWWVHS